MAQFVGIGIHIDGTELKYFSSLSITQSIFGHHTFRLVCPAEAIDGKSGSIFNASKNLIGGAFNARIDSVGNQGTMQFAGVVTQIEAGRHSGHAGDIIMSGFSPTILLDNGPHCKTWEKKAIKNIAQDVLKHFPQNLLQPKVAPAFGETLSYTVQYKETAWQFLSRLSATYGEWLYYDGKKLVLGPPQGNKVKLIFGNNLNEFNIAMQLRPASFGMMAYDYMNSEVYDGSPSGIAAKAGLSELGKHTLQKSEQFYSAKPKEWHNQFLTNKKQLDDFVNIRAATQSSNMVRFNGVSGQPSLQIGGAVSIEGKNVFNQKDESFGDYTVISVNHHCDGQGNYSNEFVAIPASVKMPPITTYTEPHSETQSAIVTDNNDPKGLGRIRVKFHWMNGSEKSPWIRVTTPHAGDSKGMYFIPEIGEEVIAGFEGDSPIKPYVIGSVYHSKAKNSYANDGNDVKTFQSRSGNKVVMNDKEGSLFLEDKDGNSMKMDGAGKVNILSKESITLSCGDSKIEMKKDGTIEITGKNITVNASEKAKMGSKQASFTATGGGGEAKMEGTKAAVNGSAEVKVAGAKTDISGSATVAVKAALITLN